MGKRRKKETSTEECVRRTAEPIHEYSAWCSSHDSLESSPPMFSSIRKPWYSSAHRGTQSASGVPSVHSTLSCSASEGVLRWQILTASSNAALSAPRCASQSSQNGRSSFAQSALQLLGRPPLQSSPSSVQHAMVMACERVAMSLCCKKQPAPGDAHSSRPQG